MDILLYTPTYYTSPGTQARINLLKKSLEIAGHKPCLIMDSESRLRAIYHTLGENLLVHKTIWKIMGKRISKIILKRCRKTVLLFLDVTASAIPYLRKKGITTILSIENLTPEYKNYNPRSSNKFFQIFLEYADQADYIISPSYTLSEHLRNMGLNVITVPIGLKPLIPFNEALSRSGPLTLLHAGQLDALQKIKILLDLASKYKIIVHNFGVLSKKLQHWNIKKYRTIIPENATSIVKKAHIGVIIEYKKTYSLTRLYFHTALLQPIIGEGKGPWIKEAEHLNIKLHQLSYIEKIYQNYSHYVKEIVKIQRKLSIPYIHSSLLNLLE